MSPKQLLMYGVGIMELARYLMQPNNSHFCVNTYLNTYQTFLRVLPSGQEPQQLLKTGTELHFFLESQGQCVFIALPMTSDDIENIHSCSKTSPSFIWLLFPSTTSKLF